VQFLVWLQETPFSRWVAASTSLWAYPSILTAHTVGLGILVGGNIAVDLRLLGFLPGTPLAPFERLFPVMWAGFWINALSGACLFAADATTKAGQGVFYVKMLFILFGVVNMVMMRRRVFRPSTAAHATEGATGRRLAAVSLTCWAAALTAGRLMAYLK